MQQQAEEQRLKIRNDLEKKRIEAFKKNVKFLNLNLNLNFIEKD